MVIASVLYFWIQLKGGRKVKCSYSRDTTSDSYSIYRVFEGYPNLFWSIVKDDGVEEFLQSIDPLSGYCLLSWFAILENCSFIPSARIDPRERWGAGVGRYGDEDPNRELKNNFGNNILTYPLGVPEDWPTLEEGEIPTREWYKICNAFICCFWCCCGWTLFPYLFFLHWTICSFGNMIVCLTCGYDRLVHYSKEAEITNERVEKMLEEKRIAEEEERERKREEERLSREAAMESENVGNQILGLLQIVQVPGGASVELEDSNRT